MDNEQPIEGQPPEVDENGQPVTPARPPAYLTRDEFTQTLQQVMGQFTDALTRQFQSQSDKRENRLEQRFQAKLGQLEQGLTLMKQTGMVDDKQEATLRAQFQQQALQQALQPDQDAEPEPDEAVYQQELVVITDQGRLIGSQLGLAPGDPELRMIVTNGTPEEYLASIADAARAKWERSLQARQPVNPARLAGLTANGAAAPRNPLAQTNDVDTLYGLAEQGFLKQYRGPG